MRAIQPANLEILQAPELRLAVTAGRFTQPIKATRLLQNLPINDLRQSEVI